MSLTALNTEPAWDDAALIARVAARDRQAFEQLFDRHSSRALGVAMRVFREQDIAEEIVQEAFWRVWRKASTFDTTRGNFVTWLLGIVQHLAIDQLRKQRGHPAAVTLDNDDDNGFELRDEGQNVAEQAWARLQSEQMRAALLRLPDAQRTVIELAYFEGLSRQEISQKLNEPLGTIHTRARLGLIKLRELLSDLEVGEQ